MSDRTKKTRLVVMKPDSNGLRCADGLRVMPGEGVEVTDEQFAVFGHLMMSMEEAKEKGVFDGMATNHAELESVDAARERIHKEEADRRKRKVSPPSLFKAGEGQPAPEPSEDGSGDVSELAGDSDQVETEEAETLTVDDEAETLTVDDEAVDLSGWTVKELRALAKDTGVVLKGLRKKADIIAAIEAAAE